MRKSLKFSLIMMCMVSLISGCTKSEETFTDIPAVTETPQPEETEEPAKEEILHPVIAEGIDYLSIEGIELEPGLEIAMIATDSKNDFYDMVKEGALQAVSDMNKKLEFKGKDKMTLTFTAPKKEDAIEQINIIDQFLDKAPDALCIAFSDAAACKTQMEMAKNNGIKLIAYDSPADSNLIETVIATDNYSAATIGAGKLFEKLEEGSKIAIIAHNSVKQTGLERYRAISNEYIEYYSDKAFRFVDVIYMVQDERSEEEIFDELLEKHPDLAGIICTDMATTEKTVEYMDGLEDKNVLIVGFDMSKKIEEAIGDGKIIGSVSQDPYAMGYATVVAAARSIAGMDNAKTVYTDHLWIDQTNLESDEVQSMLPWKK